MRAFLKFSSVAGLILLVIMVLGPENWQPRTGLGWEFDHFIGYFVITTFVCLAWPRPIVVGGALMAFGALLEGLQAFTPDRDANAMAALYGASGAFTAALIAELFIRIFSNKKGKNGPRESAQCDPYKAAILIWACLANACGRRVRVVRYSATGSTPTLGLGNWMGFQP